MKLNIVSARTGLLWVNLGIRTFFKQPLALAGLFFLFMALMSVATLIPFVGGALALALLPSATLGLMVATQEAAKGRFPMPSVMVTAFRAGRQRMRAMLVLGALYAAGFLLVMGVSALFDGGKFASLYLVGGQISRAMLEAPDFQLAMWVAMALYLPLSLVFWHAPALVHWHGIPPAKSLFFSFVACVRNFWAFTTYGLAWMGVFVVGGIVITSIAAITGSPQAGAVLMMPIALMMAAMFFTSIYFSFRDSFLADSEPVPGALP